LLLANESAFGSSARTVQRWVATTSVAGPIAFLGAVSWTKPRIYLLYAAPGV